MTTSRFKSTSDERLLKTIHTKVKLRIQTVVIKLFEMLKKKIFISTKISDVMLFFTNASLY